MAGLESNDLTKASKEWGWMTALARPMEIPTDHPWPPSQGEGSGYVLTQQFVEEVQNFLPGHPTLLPGNPCEVRYAIVDI